MIITNTVLLCLIYVSWKIYFNISSLNKKDKRYVFKISMITCCIVDILDIMILSIESTHILNMISMILFYNLGLSLVGMVLCENKLKGNNKV